MSRHTPTPWVYDPSAVLNEMLISFDYDEAGIDYADEYESGNQKNGGKYIARCYGPDKEANAERIVTCVNVMEGLTNEEVERLPKNYNQIKALLTNSSEQSADHLIGAIKHILGI